MILILACAAALLPQEKPDEAKVKELVAKLGADDLADRDAATTELLAMGDAIVPALEKARGGADGDVRARLDKVIGELTLPAKWVKDLVEDDPSRAYQRLEEIMRGKTLERPQIGRVVSALLLSDAASQDLKQYALSFAERYRLKEIWPGLVQLAMKEEPGQEYAIYYLQRIKPPNEAAPVLVKLLPKLRTQNQVQQLLEVLRGMKVDRAQMEAAMEALLDADHDDSTKMTLLSYVSQGRFHAPMRALLRTWRSHPTLRQNYLREAVLRTAPVEGGSPILEWLKSGDPDELLLAVDYVARQRLGAAAAALIEALQRMPAGDRATRPRLVAALKAIKLDEQVRPWLGGEGPLARMTLIAVARELELRGLGPDIAKCLEDRDPAVRREAAAALGPLGHESPALEARLKDDDGRVRRAAMQSIARLRGRGATKIVLESLLADDADQQAAALEVVGFADPDVLLEELTKEGTVGRPIARYALAVLVVDGGEAVLHRVMARVGAKMSADDLHAMIKLIQSVRTGR